jgi:hypothetical protein
MSLRLYMANYHSSGDRHFKQAMAMASSTAILEDGGLRGRAAGFLLGCDALKGAEIHPSGPRTVPRFKVRASEPPRYAQVRGPAVSGWKIINGVLQLIIIGGQVAEFFPA